MKKSTPTLHYCDGERITHPPSMESISGYIDYGGRHFAVTIFRTGPERMGGSVVPDGAGGMRATQVREGEPQFLVAFTDPDLVMATEWPKGRWEYAKGLAIGYIKGLVDAPRQDLAIPDLIL